MRLQGLTELGAVFCKGIRSHDYGGRGRSRTDVQYPCGTHEIPLM